MPLLSDSISEDLFQRYQGLPWGILNFLHDWCGALALACVVVHLALVWRRYVWRLKNVWKPEEYRVGVPSPVYAPRFRHNPARVTPYSADFSGYPAESEARD